MAPRVTRFTLEAPRFFAGAFLLLFPFLVGIAFRREPRRMAPFNYPLVVQKRVYG
jgi:hypothetical protein